MGELDVPQREAGKTNDGSVDRSADPKAGNSTGGPIAIVKTMLAAGASAAEVAAMIAAHPAATAEVFRFLHETRGNAFVRATIAAAPPASSVRVSASELRVRSTPDQHSHTNIVGGMHRAELVETRGRQGDWLEIDFHNAPAFIYASYTVPAELGDLHIQP